MPSIKKYVSEPLYFNSIAIMLNVASGAFFGLLFWIVAARTMSTKDVGLATAVVSAGLLIITLSKLGMDNGLIRFLPGSENKDDLYSTTMIITLIVSIVFALIFLIGLSVFSPSLIFLRDGWFPIAVIAYIALSSINGIQNVAFIALRKGGLSFIQNLIQGIRIPLLSIIFVLGVYGVLFAYSTAFLLTIVFGVLVMYRLGIKFKLTISKKSLKETLGFSLGNYTANIFSIAPATILPVLIVNTIGAENSAYFFVAYSIASFLFTIPTAISTSLFVEGSHDLPLRENVIKSFKFVALLLVPSIIVIFFFGDKILLLFNSEFSERSFELLKLLAISSIFSAVTSIYIAIKRIQKDIKIINYINFINSASLLGLGYVFLSFYGLLGIGYVWLFLNVIVCAGVVWISVKHDNFVKINGTSV
jgi:O-antigen/teichoic acid export membrane protein